MSVVVLERARRARRLDVSPRAALGYWHRNAVVFRRTWVFGAIVWFVEPLLYLVAMGTGLGAYLESIRGVSYIDFIAPGLLAVSAMYGASFETTWNTFFKMDRLGVYDAATAGPLSIEDVALGEIMWATTRASIFGSAFLIVATPFGIFKSWWGILALPALGLIGLVFSMIGLIFTYLVRRIDYMAYYWTMFLTPMFLFAGIFFPLDRLPSALRVFAWFMPLHHGTNLMRALVSDGDPVAAGFAALWLLVAAALLLPLPLYLLRRRLVR